MPGERLTSVLQLAHAKYGDTLLKRSMVSDILSIVNGHQCLCYTEEELIHGLSDIVTFSELKKIIYSKRDGSTTTKEICDQIELACWHMCKSTYSMHIVDESELFKLWQIFNILADEESFPPVISQDSAWIFEKFASYQKRGCKGRQWEHNDFIFQGFLLYLANTLDTRSIVQATNEIYEWLVKGVIKAGWINMRIKRRHNWTVWSRKWMSLSPGKILLSGGEISRYPVEITKTVFYVSEQTRLQYKHKNENKGMAHVISITNGQNFECHVATTKESEMHSWLNAFAESKKQHEEDTNPAHTILRSQGRHSEREISFTRSLTERNARKKLKDDEINASMQEVKKGSLHRLNSVNEEKNKIKAVFLELDKNGDGYLEENDIVLAAEKFGLELSASEKGEIFANIDADSDGEIIFDEFHDYFLKHILIEANSAVFKAFHEADRKKRGAINFREFSEYVRQRNSTICLDKVLSTFDKMCKTDGHDELSLQDFQCMSFRDGVDIFPDSMANFETLLRSLFVSSDSKHLKQIIDERWHKFATFRRRGANGGVVMKASKKVVQDMVPGEYNLKDLAQFHDFPELLPKVTIIEGVSWQSSNIPNTSGNLVFPFDFNGNLEVEVATSELLGYYGCTFADYRSGKVSLPFHEAIIDFTYKSNYLADYVDEKNVGAGLEKHKFPHIDCPLDEDSGYFVLGKMTGKELHVSAFKIPRKHTLYIPGNCIHTNDYLKGTWRTMLSDEADIDHVHLKRRSVNGGGARLQPFSFSFSS